MAIISIKRKKRMGEMLVGNDPNQFNYIGRIFSASNLSEAARAIVLDNSGNIYYGGTGTNGGNTGFQIVKMDPNGNILWQRRLGGNNTDNCFGLGVDSTDSLYVGGSSNISGNSAAIVAKYNSSGTLQWQRQLGESGFTYSVGDSTSDQSGNSVIVARMNTSSTPGFTIARYNASGTFQWQRALPLPGSGNVYPAAVTASTSSIHSAGYAREFTATTMFIVKYDTSGNVSWQRYFGDSNLNNSTQTWGRGVAVDSSSNVYVSGYTNVVGGVDNFILIKYNSSGTLQWQRMLSAGSSYIIGGKAFCDINDNIYVVAYSNISGNTNIDSYIFKYDSSGNLLWQRRIASSSTEYLETVTVDSQGKNLYVCGRLDADNQDFLVAKLPTNGSKTGTYTAGSFTFTYDASSFTASTPSLSSYTSTLSPTTYTATTSTPSLADNTTSLSVALGNL